MRNTKVLVEAAIMIAMAVVLEVIFKVIPGMPFGGGLSLSMLPLIVLAWRRGVLPGMVAGAIFGMLNLYIDGGTPVAFGVTAQAFVVIVIMDYFLAFGLIGLSAFVKKLFGDNIYTFSASIFLAGLIRFTIHLITGIVIFGQWAPEGQTKFMYSLIYNGTYMLPTTILLLVVGLGLYASLSETFSTDEEIY